MLALNVASYTGWVDGEPASLAYDDLAFSLVYKQLLECIYRTVLYVTIYASNTREPTVALP
jgi:hypothetical protein